MLHDIYFTVLYKYFTSKGCQICVMISYINKGFRHNCKYPLLSDKSQLQDFGNKRLR